MDKHIASISVVKHPTSLTTLISLHAESSGKFLAVIRLMGASPLDSRGIGFCMLFSQKNSNGSPLSLKTVPITPSMDDLGLSQYSSKLMERLPLTLMKTEIDS